jgi:nucleoside-diphosphate-sugar epimerase
MRKVLIIGGAGYVGTVLTDHLLNKNYQVRSFDQFLYQNNHCVLSYLGREGYESRCGDLCDNQSVLNSLDGVTDVVLLAGLVGDPITKKFPAMSRKINDEGIQRLIELLNGRGLDRLIFVSTCSNYGLIQSDQLADEEFDLKPLSLYAKAKVAAEEKLLSMRHKTDFSPTILRFATAFGLSPRMRFDLTVSEFTRHLALGKELLVFDAQTWRPYCHVRDFAKLIQLVLEAPRHKVAHEVFNAGDDSNNYTKQMIVDAVLEYLPSSRVKYQQHGEDPRNYRVDFQKVREELNFTAQYSVKDGIAELLAAIEGRVFDDFEKNPDKYGNYELQTRLS